MSTAERSTPPHAPRSRDVEVDEDDLLTVPDRLVMGFLVTNPALARKLKARREKSPSAPRDEVWEGVYVMSPMANYEHQRFVGRLTTALTTIVDLLGGGDVLPGLNVSDRVEDWKANYREPDVAVYLPGNPAIFRKAFVCGGPDFAVEILSDNDLARKKLDFYAKVNTRELLILDRDPWALELYRLTNGKLELVGISTPETPETLTSGVLPLTLRLVPGETRPTIELCRLDGGQTWRI
jgi:Uma2 family endonuclease